MSQPTYQAHLSLNDGFDDQEEQTISDLSRAEARGIARLLETGIYIAGGVTFTETIDGQTTYIHTNDLLTETA